MPLVEAGGLSFRNATNENVRDGTFPLGRFLFLYINRKPGMPLDPMIREFCRFVFSREGQEIVIEDGYIPVPPEIASEELAKIEPAGS